MPDLVQRLHDVEVPGGLVKDDRSRAPDPTLRLALVMRGGVSLAVWIGGAVAEIDLLRRAARLSDGNVAPVAERKDIYARMLEAAGYAGVEVDVLAGASAGGLNAVIYGLAQSVGRTTDWVKDVWCDVGSIWSLLRPTLPRGDRERGVLRVTSLLRGDHYFYDRLASELLAIEGRPAAEPGAAHLSIDLSATLADRPRRPADLVTARPSGASPGRPPSPSERSAVHFRFERRPVAASSMFTDLPGADELPGPGPNDVGSPEPPLDEPAATARRQVERLAYAGRATSSFPGAFEPATIRTEETDPPAAAGSRRWEAPNLRGLFSETSETRTFAVIDGGIFDNIPIGRALDAIAAAPADGPVERRLIFLDPSPGARPEATRKPVSSVRQPIAAWVPTILRALSLKVREENSQEEIELVGRYNEDVAAARGRLDVLAAELGRLPSDADLPAGLVLTPAQYADYRASRDVEHLALLLTRPSATMLRASTPPVDDALAVDQRDALQLGAELRAAYRALPASLLGGDALAFMDVTAILIVWCRALEALCRRRGTPCPAAVSETKQTLHRLMAVGRHLRDLSDRRLVITTAGEVDLFRDAVGGALTAQLGWPAAPLADLHTVDDRTFWTAMGTVFGAGQDRSGTLLDCIWEQLGRRKLAVLECTAAVVAEARGDEEWSTSLFAQLARPFLFDLPLAQVNALVAVAGGGPGLHAEIRYHEISGDQPTPLNRFLGRTIDAERRRRVTELLRDKDLDAEREFARGPVDERRPLLDAGSKLTGNFLANFSAFLARDWRVHDWRWGRLDAAAGLVDVVLDGTYVDPVALAGLCTKYVCTLPRGVDASTWSTVVGDEPDGLDVPATWSTDDVQRRQRLAFVRRALQARLQYDVLRDDAPAAAGRTDVLRAAAETLDRPKVSLAELKGRYLFGLASRLTHLAYRGAWPSTWSFPTVVVRLVLVALRPALMCLPLLGAPVRALLVLAGLAWLGAPENPTTRESPPIGPWALPAGAVFLLGTAVFTGARALWAWGRWRDVARSAASVDAGTGWGAVPTWRSRAGWKTVAVVVVALTVAGWAVLVLRAAPPPPPPSWLPWLPWPEWTPPPESALWMQWAPSALLLVTLAAVGHFAVDWVRNAPPLPCVSWAAVVRSWAFRLVALGAVVVGGVAALRLGLHAMLDPHMSLMLQVALVAAGIGAMLHDGWAQLFGVVAAASGCGVASVLACATPLPPMWAAVAGVGVVTAFSTGVLPVRDVQSGKEVAGA